MKRTWKQISSLILAVCMVLTMLPTAAFAYTNGLLEYGDTFTLRTTAKLSGNTTVSNYTIGSNSVQWANDNSTQTTFNAWYPTCGNMDSDVTVGTLKVSTLPKPDLMMASPVQGTRTGGVTLQFKHVMHRLVVNLSKDSSVPDNLNDATIALKNMDGSANVNFSDGTVVGSNSGDAYPARGNGAAIIIAPQTLQVGSDWIEVRIGTDYAQTFKVPVGSTDFLSGKQTILNLQLQSDGIIFLSQSVMPWDANGDGSEDVSTVTLDIASIPALTAPTNPGWANSTPGIAKWDAVDNASGYTIQLYKDNLPVGTIDAGKALEYNLTSKVAETGNGDYIFNVQARGNGTTLPDSGWSGYSAKYIYVKPDPDQAAVDAFKLQLEGITWTTKENTRQNIEDDIDPKLTNLMGPPYYCDMEYKITEVVPASPGLAGSFKVNFKLIKNAATATTTVNGTIEALPLLPATVTGVTVFPDTATVQKGVTQQFTATVAGTNNPSQEVIWTVDGGTSRGTSISAGGLLTVGADESEPTLTVWATSTADQTKSGIAEVTVIPLAAPANPVWDDATSPHIAKWDAVADAAVYRVVLYNGNKQIGGVIETGTVTQYDFTNAITAAGYGSFTFEVQVKVNTGNYSKWSDRSAVLPLFSPVNSVEVSPTTATVQKGATRQFTATVNATDGTAQTVTWELVGNTSANTSVSADGLLTVGADETGTILNVTAVSTVDISKTSTAAVVVPSVETLANTLINLGLTADVSGNTVTVTGTKAATDTLSLTIPTGVKMLWNASLTGAADAPLILLNGDGIFELAGGEIVNTSKGGALSSWDTSLVISGGIASSASNDATVKTYHTGEDAPTITMTDGNVISTSDDLSSCAISAGGKTVITGGTVTAQDGNQVFLNNTVVVYRSDLLTKIDSKSISASIAVSPSKTYALPTETDGLTATGYTALVGNVTAQWNYSNSGWTGIQVDYSGNASGSWKISYPAVQVVSGKHVLTYNANGGAGATPFSIVYKGQSYTVSTNIFTRTNYTFTGWNTEADGTGTPYAEGATLIGGPGSEDIVLYAQWSPATTYTVTFDLAGGNRTGGGELTQAIVQGSAATAPTVTRSGYTFNGWDKSFSNITETMTVTALWTYNSGSGGNTNSGSPSGGGSISSEPTPTVQPEKKPDQLISAEVAVTAKADKTGLSTVAVSEKSITNIIAKAQTEAKTEGTTDNGIGVALNVTMPKGSDSLNLTLTANSLQSLINANVQNLEINGAPVSLGLNLKALQEIQKQSTGNISISITPATGLSKEAKALIGSRPVYSITISTVKDGKTINVTSLGTGTATLSIPYTPGKNEVRGYLFGVYVDSNGKANRINGSAYDTNTGAILLPTGHFLVYGVGYTAPSARFTDVGTHWGKESIDYVVGRGLLSGTSETTFAPNTAMTRGMLVTALGRLAGVDVKAYTTNSFTDVKSDSTFRPYIEWAYSKGIVQGIGNQQFAPDRAITREEIAAIFSNYVKANGYKLPVTREAATYADADHIGSAYKTAVTAMQQAGIMMGGTDNKFNPTASATRAEVSAMLYRYIKLTIAPATAQGWALNDAGQYLYYKDGKALTGTQTINSVKYYFNTDGTLKTGWVQDGSNWRYYTGNKAAVGWLNISDKRCYFTTDGLMVSGKWLQIDNKWYYFYADGALAKDTKVDGYEVGSDGARKTK